MIFLELMLEVAKEGNTFFFLNSVKRCTDSVTVVSFLVSLTSLSLSNSSPAERCSSAA